MKKYIVAALLLVSTSSTSYAECLQWQQFGNRSVCVQHSMNNSFGNTNSPSGGGCDQWQQFGNRTVCVQPSLPTDTDED